MAYRHCSHRQPPSQSEGRPAPKPLAARDCREHCNRVRRRRLSRRSCRTRRRRYLAAQSTVMFIRAVTEPPMSCSGWRSVGPSDPAMAPIPDAGDRDSRTADADVRPFVRPSGSFVIFLAARLRAAASASRRVDRAAPAANRRPTVASGPKTTLNWTDVAIIRHPWVHLREPGFGLGRSQVVVAAVAAAATRHRGGSGRQQVRVTPPCPPTAPPLTSGPFLVHVASYAIIKNDDNTST